MTPKLLDVVVQLRFPDAPQVRTEPPALRAAATLVIEVAAWASPPPFFNTEPAVGAWDFSITVSAAISPS
jgi:hypothetical protein